MPKPEWFLRSSYVLVSAGLAPLGTCEILAARPFDLGDGLVVALCVSAVVFIAVTRIVPTIRSLRDPSSGYEVRATGGRAYFAANILLSLLLVPHVDLTLPGIAVAPLAGGGVCAVLWCLVDWMRQRS